MAFALIFAFPALAQPTMSFADFVRTFEAKAVAVGIPRAVYEDATSGLTPDPRTPNLISSQPEFTTPMWDYLDGRVNGDRVARGRKAVAANADLFKRIGAHYQVDPYILGAIWGMETDYGAVLGSNALIRPVVRSLATVAHQRRGRVAADEAELIAALRLIATQHWTKQTLVGSWAGAIGHTQVIVSGLLTYGADGDGDGRVDPHRSLADALATSANYLVSLGYRTGEDWGFEVAVPQGFDYLLADRDSLHPISFFMQRGVTRVSGRAFADPSQQVFLYVPAGQNGPKFLMTRNYLVLKSYNFSDSYALSVAHLTDRLKGAGGFVASWPRNTSFPNRAERVAIQSDLKRLGYYDGEVDGRIGPVSQRAYQKFQSDRGRVADGFITRASKDELAQAR